MKDRLKLCVHVLSHCLVLGILAYPVLSAWIESGSGEAAKNWATRRGRWTGVLLATLFVSVQPNLESQVSRVDQHIYQALAWVPEIFISILRTISAAIIGVGYGMIGSHFRAGALGYVRITCQVCFFLLFGYIYLSSDSLRNQLGIGVLVGAIAWLVTTSLGDGTPETKGTALLILHRRVLYIFNRR